MIQVTFVPEKLSPDLKKQWDNWQEKANKATEKIIKSWEENGEVNYDNGIWTELKKWLLDNVFHGKCAYCETHLGGARQPGDAEHFRPKSGVNYKKPEKNNSNYIQAVTIDETCDPPRKIKHPGYFWLAYNWKNLLPACNFCNHSQGKKEQFPICQKEHVFLKKLSNEEVLELKSSPISSKKWPGFYYLEPEDLDKIEGCQLLNPYNDNPAVHIGFDEFGGVYPKDINNEKSQKGIHSIAVYDLWDEDLRIRRHTAQEAAENKFSAALAFFRRLRGKTKEEAIKEALKEEKIANILNGKTEYSAASLERIESEYGFDANLYLD